MMKPSIVAKSFGPRGDDAAPFVNMWIPKRWKPKILSNGLWLSDEGPSGSAAHGYIARIVKLENFPSHLLLVDVVPHSARSRERVRKTYKSFRDNLLRWLYQLEDAGRISRSQSGGGFGIGYAHCDSNYKVGGVRGSFTATIIRLGLKSAVLNLHLAESVIWKPSRMKNHKLIK